MLRLNHCTNCDAPLLEKEAFCPYCGQKNLDRKISLWVFFKEFLGEYARLDAKLFKSIISIIFKPGVLTLEYWAGKRKAYFRPTQIFLFAGLIAFLLFNWQMELNNAEESNIKFSFPEEVNSLEGKNFLERHIIENISQAKEKPIILVKKILSQLPIVLLILLPVYTFFVKLFFRKKSAFLVEHFVHVLHVHAFIFFIGGLLSALAIIGIKFYLLYWLAFVSIITYLFVSMKRVYQENIGRLIWKFLILTIIYLLLIPIGSLLISMIAGILF